MKHGRDGSGAQFPSAGRAASRYQRWRMGSVRGLFCRSEHRPRVRAWLVWQTRLWGPGSGLECRPRPDLLGWRRYDARPSVGPDHRLQLARTPGGEPFGVEPDAEPIRRDQRLGAAGTGRGLMGPTTSEDLVNARRPVSRAPQVFRGSGRPEGISSTTTWTRYRPQRGKMRQRAAESHSGAPRRRP